MQDTFDAILKAAAGLTPWDDALDRVCFEVGAPASALFMSEDPKLQSKTSIFSSFWRAPERQSIRDIFSADLDVSLDGPAYKAFGHMPHSELISERQIFASLGVEMPPSPVRDLTFSFGFNNRIVSILNENAPWLDALTFQVSDDSLDHKAFGKLAPVLSSAMRMRRTLIDARRNSLAAVDALDRMQIGVFAATRSGQVFFRNAEANRQIDSCPQVSVVQDRLTVTGLSRHLFETNDTDAVVLNDQLLSLHCGEVLVLPSAEQSLPLLVQIELSAGICEDDTWMIFVCDLDRLRGTGKDVLASIAGLTQAETEVLNALSRGADLAHIARLRDTSKVTVRNQLSSVLNKLRCKSQKDAVALNAVTSLAQLRDPKA